MNVLVTGGTGSFGQAMVRALLLSPAVERVVVYSRDELKQHEMRTRGFTDPRLRFFIGDVRDRDRLRRALHGIDTVIHAAALKQVPSCEYNPSEAIATNIGGADNLVHAALDAGVRNVLALGTDKAVDPNNLYGFTKGAAERLFVDANAYAGQSGTRFAATRYGNVISSRGSVLPLFQAQHANRQPLTVTDTTMTRFVLTLADGVRFINGCLKTMQGGEVFVPKLKAASVKTIAEAVTWPDPPNIQRVGARPGEKHDETLISAHEIQRTLDREWHYLLEPTSNPHDRVWDGFRVPPEFRYRSDTVPRLNVQAFRELAGLGVIPLVAA